MRSLQFLAGDDVMYRTNCHVVGKIETFYPDDQTADISLTVQRKLPAGIFDLPMLVKCPVCFLTGGSTGRITMPVQSGDTCLVLFHDRDLETWWATGTAAPPKTRRAHDLSDGLALVGFRHKGNVVGDYSTTDIEVKNLGSEVTVGTAVHAESTNGALLNLAAKAKLANDSTSLKTVLDSLLDALIAATDTGGHSFSSGTISALNAVKSDVSSLLET